MTGPIKLKFWCDDHKFVEAGFGEPITEVHFNQRGELGLACPLCYKSRPMTIVRWTGVLDPYGTPAHEGDIVGNRDGSKVGVVIWHNESGGFAIDWQDRTALGSLSSWFGVIGNIYENAGLLEANS
ncbi:YopX family protein [Rhodococcus sp. B10]|uniref:YopX family protein n=1 Tax=Rhodococcus sp. B10 TaxID=2695876 RepID=UPI0014303F66|nr:YopX family protein [Rhodococcus sp. B10]NIL77160.1 hypothetical protein [Rhodococcus sp. B10]